MVVVVVLVLGSCSVGVALLGALAASCRFAAAGRAAGTALPLVADSDARFGDATATSAAVPSHLALVGARAT